MSKQKSAEITVSTGREGSHEFRVPIHSRSGERTTESGLIIPSAIDVVQVVGGPGVSGSGVGYEQHGYNEYYYGTAIPQEGAVYLDGKAVDVEDSRDSIIHEMGFDHFANIPFGIFAALNSDIRILQPSSFGAATYLGGRMYVRDEHSQVDGIVFRSPYFMTPEEGLQQIADKEVVKSSGLRFKMLSELIPDSALHSRQAFMSALRERYYEAKVKGDQHTMAQIALGLVGHQLKVGEATDPDNIPAKLQKLLVNQDWMYGTKKPERVLALINKFSGADAYLGAELLFQFEQSNTDLVNGYEDTLEQLYAEKELIREAIGSTALGKAVILSGGDDKLTPRNKGAETFQRVIGSDLVEVRTVTGAGHPGYDRHMRLALRSTMHEIVDEIARKKGL
jgi:hypothetical protein